MALPGELEGVEPVKGRGIGGGRSGEWRIGDLQGRFECRRTHGAELRLAATTHPTRDERVGTYRAGDTTRAVDTTSSGDVR